MVVRTRAIGSSIEKEDRSFIQIHIPSILIFQNEEGFMERIKQGDDVRILLQTAKSNCYRAGNYSQRG